MATNRDNFKAWYVTVLESLYSNQNAGFILVMVALVLLERYLRQKAGLAPQAPLSDDFYQGLSRLLPELRTKDNARQFWQVYRNGLLHEVTFSRQSRSGATMPVGRLTHELPGIAIEADGSFRLNPVDFAKKVLALIQADFVTFEDSTTAAPLPIVEQVPHPTSNSARPSTYLGTRTGP